MSIDIGVVLFLLACLSGVWALLGVLNPRIVLWWAVQEKQTRGRAAAFGINAGLVFLLACFSLTPEVSKLIWFLCFAMSVNFVRFILDSRVTDECLRQRALQRAEEQRQDEILRQREKQKKAESRRKRKNIGKCVKVYSYTSDREYLLHPYTIMCSCPDWEKKRRDSYDIFRCCKHLTAYYCQHEEDVPPSLQRFKDILSHYGNTLEGIPYGGRFSAAGSVEGPGGKMFYLASGDKFPWVTVYTSLTKGSFNVATGQWGRGDAPYTCREQLAEILQKEARRRGFSPANDTGWKKPWLQEVTAFLGHKPSPEEDAELRKKLGGDRECLYNLRMASARLKKGEVYCLVPRDDHYRSRFEALQTGGGATVFTEISTELLAALTQSQLRAIGKAAGLDKLGRDKASSCRILAELPQEKLVAAWSASGVDVKDIFKLNLLG